MTRACVQGASRKRRGGPASRSALFAFMEFVGWYERFRWFEMGLIDWALGILTKRVEVRDRQQEIEQGIRADLEKLAGRLAGVPFLISYRLGGFNKELTDWVADRFAR